MTKETDIWKKYSPKMNYLGYAVRIETSTMGGFPDIVFLTKKGIFLIELKIAHGRFVRLENYQVAFHTRAMPYVHNSHEFHNQDWFWIDVKGELWCYTWLVLKSCPTNPLVNGVQYEYKANDPDFIMSGPADLEAFLERIA